MIDPTTLETTAQSLLALLEQAAVNSDWDYSRACATPGPVSVDCDSIYVWADAINPVQDQLGGKCPVVHRVQFQYVVALCVGTDTTCEGWAVGAVVNHDTAWGVQTNLIASILNGEWCDDPCSTVRYGTFTLLTNTGGYSWWQGTIQIDLSPEVLAEGAIVSPGAVEVEGGA